MPKLLSGKIKVTPADQLSPSRYKYIQLSQAQPALGKPAVANSILLAQLDGTTVWVPQSSLVTKITPTKNVIYVSKNGNDSNEGSSISSPKLSLRSALSAATDGTSIVVYSGDYLEVTPLIVPANVSIIGQESRVNIIPQEPTADVFKLKSGTTIQGITVIKHKAPSFAFSISSDAIILAMPILKNCSSITGPFLADGTLFVSNYTIQNSSIGITLYPLPDSSVPDITKRVDKNLAGGGVSVEGANFSALSLYKGMILDTFTAINQGGIGIYANNASIQATSCITEFCSISFYAYNGGVINLVSCSSKYGTYGLKSDEYNRVPYIENALVSDTLYSSISTIVINNDGSGYLTAPTIVISPPDDTVNGIQATALAIISNDSVTSIAITEPGSGYSSPPTITISGAHTTIAVAIAELTGITQIPIGLLSKKPVTSTLVQFQDDPAKQYVTASTEIVGTAVYIKISPDLNYIQQGKTASFYRESIIIANTHTFIYVGAGVTLNALPENSGETITLNQVVESNYGKVFYSGITETGLFKVGEIFLVDSITGATTINNTSVNLSAISAIGPLIRNGAPSGVQLREISNDPNLIATTGLQDGFTAPTQHAVATFLVNNYLSLTGGTITGEVKINQLAFNNNTVSSISTGVNADIIFNPKGTGKVDFSNSRLINLLDPTSSQDAATKAYVDLVAGGTIPITSSRIGNFFIHDDIIESAITNGNMNLTTDSAGSVIITSLTDSSSSSTGAFITYGGVGIGKKLFVGTEVRSPLFYGTLVGSADTVSNSTQSAITQVGTLTSLTVDQIYINGDTIKNIQIDGLIKLGITGSGAVIPETNNVIDFGNLANNWRTGYFNNLNGTILTSNQPNIASLAPNVSIFNSAYSTNPSLNIGYTETNKLEIITNHDILLSLQATQFITRTVATGTTAGRIEFRPNDSSSLIIDPNMVTVEHALTVTEDLILINPILTLGSRRVDTITNNDFGFDFTNSINLTLNVSSININSYGTYNTAIVNLTTTVSALSITTNDLLFIDGMIIPNATGNWKIISANLLDTFIEIEIIPSIPTGNYVVNPTISLLTRHSFFGYNKALDAVTFIPSAAINDKIVTGLPGTISANLISSSAVISGGKLNNVTIGDIYPSSASFTKVTTNEIKTTTSVTIIAGTPTLIDSFDGALVGMAKYILKIKNYDINTLTGQELIIIHDTTNVTMSEYGIVSTSQPIGFFSSLYGINGHVELYFNPFTNDNIRVSLIKFYA